jgi:glycosyltransferase involved in cell wall biosynthesis
MKIVIQIPCYNEERHIAAALDALPRALPGAEAVEALVIDDGSEDRTAEVAKAHPLVKRVVRLPHHQGLASAFKAGIEAALEMGADVIVNTDADNQYPASRIQDLVRPILEGRADFAIGCRHIEAIQHFPLWKKFAQRLGSRVVSAICGRQVPDVTSGFRAFSRGAALWLDVIVSEYTYTLETLIRLASRKTRMSVIEVEANPPVRSSRLMKSNLEYIIRSLGDILALFYIYSPLKLFVPLSVLFLAPGLFLCGRFLYYYALLAFFGQGSAGYIQSLTIGTGLLVIGIFILLMGVVSHLIQTNRRLLEKILVQQQGTAK